MKQTIENIIKKNLPEKLKGHEIITHPSFEEREKNYVEGFDDAIDSISPSLIADEVLKVVVEKIEMLYGDIVTTKKDIAIPHNCIEYETALDDVVNLLSNLSPNKENKNNE